MRYKICRPPTPPRLSCSVGSRGCRQALPPALSAPADDARRPIVEQSMFTDDSRQRHGIRPFPFEVPEAALADLRRRINATRWPERETVTDHSQGVQLATMQKLARYWATDYDWRKVRGEAQRPAALHHRDRRARHSLHPRALEA